MNSPTQPTEGEHPSSPTLQQFLDRDLSRAVALEVERHLAACAQCRLQLRQLAQAGNGADPSLIALSQAFVRKGLMAPVPRLAPREQIYPDFEIIAAYVDGTLSREEAQKFEAWMQQLPALTQEVAELRALKEDLQSVSEPSQQQIAQNMVRQEPRSMAVKQPKSAWYSAQTWWTQWRWPLQSLGIATAMALLVFIAVKMPWQRRRSNRPGQPTPVSVVPTMTPQSSEGTVRGGSQPIPTPQKSASQSRKSAFQAQLLALSNPQQALLRSVKIRPYKVEGRVDRDRWYLAQNPPIRQPLPLSGRLEFKRAEGIQFHFDNQAGQTLYLAALWLAQDGSVNFLTYPQLNHSTVLKLTPKGTGDSKATTDYYGLDLAPKLSSGVDYIEVFVSTRSINSAYLKYLESVLADKGVLQARKPRSPLEVALGRALGVGTKKSSSVSVDANTWAATTYKIHIREK